MSNSSIVDGTKINCELSFGPPKPNPTGGKVVNMYNKVARESLTVSVPLMGAWSAQEVKLLDGTPTGKYTTSLQFSSGDYATPEANLFLEELKKLEMRVKQEAMTNSKDWFGKAITSMDVIDEKFNSMLKYPKINKTSEERDYSKMPTLTLKLPCFKEVWQTSVFDEDGNPLYIKGKSPPDVSPLNFLISNSKSPIQVICLIQSAGIWIVNSKVSITWNLKQVVVKKPKTSCIADDVCFLPIRETDRAALKALPETEPTIEFAHDTTSASVLVEDSDNEDQQPPVVAKATEAVAKAEDTKAEETKVAEVVVAVPVSVPEPIPAAVVPEKKKVFRKKVDA